MGDSAGGNLATMLGLALANRDILSRLDTIDPATLPTVRSISSLYGVMDRLTFREDGFPSARLFLQSYAGVDALTTRRPALAVTPMDLGDFTNLPPTFVVGASKDQLARSSKVWAEHLRTRFSQVGYQVYEGASHGFFSFGTGSAALSEDLRHFLEST